MTDVFTPEVLDKFWARVNKTAGCWNWTGYLDRSGYGRVKHDNKRYMVHRVSYELLVGPIPEGYHIDHLCRVRSCLNPAHLEAVTVTENNIRAAAVRVDRDPTHCKSGHPYTEDNTVWRARPNGRFNRDCRTCKRRRTEASRHRTASAA